MIGFITADRNDRPELLQHCKDQVSKFVTLGNHYIVDYPAKNGSPDLTERVKYGFDAAKADGCDWVFIVENDDAYPVDHIHKLMRVASENNADFVGCDTTYYYNLRNRTWEQTRHPNHSSLFCTGFKVKAMENFKWHLAHKVFLDIDIWKYAKRYKRTFITTTGAIGMKHGIGLTGGKGHIQRMPNHDPDLVWLKRNLSPESFEFYSNLKVS